MVNGYQAEKDAPDNPVKVAVLDSGIDFISDVTVEKSVNLVEDERDITYYMNDMTGHGTSMASIITAMNPDAQIYSVRVLDEGNEAPLSRIIEGIQWCMDNDVDVINMSFGTSQYSQLLEQKIAEAEAEGIVIVAAAGNSGAQGVEYPAAYDGVLAVGAVDAQAGKTDESAVGSEVDIVAPGKMIITQTMLGLYGCSDGTSLAAAHATGAASIIKAVDPGKDATFVDGLLKATANELGNGAGYGNGLLDVQYALENYETYADAYESGRDQPSEAAEIIAENPAPVQTFSEDDVTVKGLWYSGGHTKLATEAIDYANGSGNYVELSGIEASIFKKGAIFQDNNYAMKEVIWHGSISYNYISDYRFITKIASMAGDTDSIKKGVNGLTKHAYTEMKDKISLRGIKYGKKDTKGNPAETISLHSWTDIIEKSVTDMKAIDTNVGKGTYSGAGIAEKEKMRKLFLYGVSLHAISDAFAHASYENINGTWVRLQGNSDFEDKASYLKNRFIDAGRAARRVIIEYNKSEIGYITDFRPNAVGDRGYRMGELMNCAINANGGVSNETLISAFKDLDYDDPTLTLHKPATSWD